MSMESGANSDAQNNSDPFGIVAVFQTHLEIALNHSHPLQAFEGAQHATRAYINSYDFVDVSDKGSPVPEYRMVRKREVANKMGGGR